MALQISDRLRYAQAAGFAGEEAVTMVSITLCECGIGSPCETGCNPDSYGVSCGLIQCFSVHSWYRECTDPAAAFRHAHDLYLGRGGGFADWSTFNNGCYRGHLAEVRAVLASMSAPPPPPPPPPDPGVPPDLGCPPGSTLSGGLCYPDPIAVAAPAGSSALPLLILLAGAGALAFLEHRSPGTLTAQLSRVEALGSRVRSDVGSRLG